MKETLKAVQRIELHDKISFKSENKLPFYCSQLETWELRVKIVRTVVALTTHNYLITGDCKSFIS